MTVRDHDEEGAKKGEILDGSVSAESYTNKPQNFSTGYISNIFFLLYIRQSTVQIKEVHYSIYKENVSLL